MNADLREEYKDIILRMSRLAAEGDAGSQAYEDYLIDNLDEIIDRLPDKDFLYLVSERKMPVREIESEEDYQYHFWHRNLMAAQLEKSLYVIERERLESGVKLLTQLLDEYKAEEWA